MWRTERARGESAVSLVPGFDELSLPIYVMNMTKALLAFAGGGPDISLHKRHVKGRDKG